MITPVDETAIPNQEEIERLAEKVGIAVEDYTEVAFVNLATDGYDREWTEDGRFGNEYHSFYAKESFLSASAFQDISGISLEIRPGRYIFLFRTDYPQSPYDYIEEMQHFTKPTTMQTLDVAFQREVHYDMLHDILC